MSKWIAEFELEDGDTMPEHMDLHYMGGKIDFHCKPLEQEPTTKNNLGVTSGLEKTRKNSKKLEKDFGELDCISRAEVLKLMQDNWHTHNGDWAMQESMDDIRALPSVTPIRPKGHWIENAPEYQNIDPPYICSECGNMHLRKTNYCDQCGADMRISEE